MVPRGSGRTGRHFVGSVPHMFYSLRCGVAKIHRDNRSPRGRGRVGFDDLAQRPVQRLHAVGGIDFSIRTRRLALGEGSPGIAGHSKRNPT
jgi:hypothetical protein